MRYPRRAIPWHVELRALLFTRLIGKEIAAQMGLTHGTVKIYAQKLYAKLGIHNRIDLMASEIERLSILVTTMASEIERLRATNDTAI
jgi:uncharacterized small protein (DUF1192 family)